MHSELIQSMREQARTIYQAVTGTEMPEGATAAEESAAPVEEVTRSFAELEALARMVPGVAERVAPFSFTPALDAFIDGVDLIVELALPGVDRDDVAVERADSTLVVSGMRRGRGGAYTHAEIPHGPFYRTFYIPFATRGEPTVNLDRGLLRIRLSSEETSREASGGNTTGSQ
jgi:HSP20 family molecular chaperone IbpA